MHPSNTVGVTVRGELELRMGRLGFQSQKLGACTEQGQVLSICDFLAALETGPPPRDPSVSSVPWSSHSTGEGASVFA